MKRSFESAIRCNSQYAQSLIQQHEPLVIERPAKRQAIDYLSYDLQLIMLYPELEKVFNEYVAAFYKMAKKPELLSVFKYRPLFVSMRRLDILGHTQKTFERRVFDVLDAMHYK